MLTITGQASKITTERDSDRGLRSACLFREGHDALAFFGLDLPMALRQAAPSTILQAISETYEALDFGMGFGCQDVFEGLDPDALSEFLERTRVDGIDQVITLEN